jgi:ketosteroid isomerase-like protein
MSFGDAERLHLRMQAEVLASMWPVEQVQAAEDALAQAVFERDRDTFQDLLADDGEMVVCRRTLHGKPAIMAALQSYFDGAEPAVCCECLRIEVLNTGMLAFSSGELLDHYDRSPVGAFESIWRRDPGQVWRLAFTQASFSRAAAGVSESAAGD